MRRTSSVVPSLVLSLQLTAAQLFAQEQKPLHLAKWVLNLPSPPQAENETRQKVADLGGRGPGAPIDLYAADLRQLDRFDGLDLRDLCRYSLTVYPDVNADSGIFYYRPHRYVLRFDPEEGGYFLHLDYKYGSEGTRNVLIQARLTPGADPVDKEILEAVLVTHLRAEGTSNPNPKLLLLPATPEAEFNLTDWNVDQVTINGIDLDTGEIQLTLSADVPTKELVSNTISDQLGLSGHVRLTPLLFSDSQLTTGAIPLEANIRLADIASGPSMRFPSSGGTIRVENEWPFAMRLKHLVYMVRENDGGLKLRGWNLLDDRPLQPNDTATLKLQDLNREVRSDSAIAPMFVASLERDLEIGRAVIESLTGGVGALPLMQLSIDVVQPETLYQQYSIYKVAVEVRSAHFDPEGRSVEGRTYEIDDSGDEVKSEPLYLWEDVAQGDLYQFRVGVVTTDGVLHMDRHWRPPNPMLKDTVTIGTNLVEEVLAQ
jgi:hypothetical protein